jgi:hypothetical protein
MLWMLWMTAWAQTPGLTCADGERVRVQCTTAKGAKLALCQTDAGWSYRYGAQAVELSHDGPFWTTRIRRGPDGEVRTVGFEREGHTYAVVVARTEDQFDVRIDVAKGGKVLASLPCGGLQGVDLTEIALPAPPASSWVGTWSGPTGSLTIAASGDTLSVQGDAAWHGASGQVHTGELDGPLRADGDALVYQKDGCEARLGREGGRLWVSDNLKCGGMNVSFEGTYAR